MYLHLIFFLITAVAVTFPCLLVKAMRQVHEGEPTWITTIFLTVELLILHLSVFYLFLITH